MTDKYQVCAGEGPFMVPSSGIEASVLALGNVVRKFSGEGQDLAVREYLEMIEHVAKTQTARQYV